MVDKNISKFNFSLEINNFDFDNKIEIEKILKKIQNLIISN